MKTLIVADSTKWLKEQGDKSIPNVVTGIPDLDEMNLDLDSYLTFFKDVTREIFRVVQDDGYAIFIQTDRKYKGQWIDKSYLISSIAHETGHRLLWHKIVLNRDVGKTDLFRPTYSHILCYSLKGKPGKASPDVLPKSRRIYKNGTPIDVARFCCQFIKDNKKGDKTILDSFVGRGTITTVCTSLEIDSIGIDIDNGQIEYAKVLSI